MDMSDLSAYVHKLLTRRGWSLRRLAEESHTNASTVSRVLAGKIQPTRDTLEAWATALEVDPYHLYALSGYSTPPRAFPPVVARLAQVLSRYPLEVQERVAQIAYLHLEEYDARAEALAELRALLSAEDVQEGDTP